MSEFSPPIKSPEERESIACSLISFELLGNRDYQQDAHGNKTLFTNEGSIELFAVADGHGEDGGRISQIAIDTLLSTDQSILDPRLWIEEQFHRASERLKEEQGGTTASLCVRQGKKLIIGYVGDSEVRLVKKDGHLSTLTIPHHYGVNQKETQRLDKIGAMIHPTQLNQDGLIKKA
jgi:serine/threonine protein phosphatase PrpC